MFTAAHELTHYLREYSPEKFDMFAEFIISEYIKNGENIQELIRDKMRTLKLSYDSAYEEVIADSCESFLVDSNLIEQVAKLSNKDKSLADKIKDFIKNLLDKIKQIYKSLQPDTYEGRYVRSMQNSLAQLHDMWTQGILEAGKISNQVVKKSSQKTKNTANNDGVKYSLNRNAKTELHKALYDINYREDVLLRDVTPPIMLAQKGVKNLPMVMKSSHIRENVFTEAEAKQLGLRVDKHTHYHGLGEEFYLKIIDGLDEVKEAYRGTKNADDTSRRESYFLLISQFKDTNGNIVNVPVYINETTQHNRVFIDSNKISTVFGRENFRAYIFNEIKNGNLVKIKNKSNTSSERNALIAKGYRSTASDNRISQDNSSVNNNSMQKKQKNSSRVTAEMDSKYMSAVERGDIETAQRMVDEAAKASGYTIRAYHGTLSERFTVFDKSYIGSRFSFDDVGFFFIDRKSIADDYAHSEYDASRKGFVFDVYLKVKKPLNVNKQFCLSNGLGNPFRDDDAIGVWDSYCDYFKEEAETKNADGVILDDGVSKMIVVFDSEQIKSADPVTYDDNGEVIPLSKRFDVENEDIRYSSRYAGIDLNTLDDNELRVYNNRAWASDLFTKEDHILLNEKFNELNKKTTQKTDNVLGDGSRVVEVNNKLVLIGGTFKDPIIYDVLVVNADNETVSEIFKELLLNDVKDNYYSAEGYRNICKTYEHADKKENIRNYESADFSHYKGRKDTGERAVLPDSFKSYGYTKQFSDRGTSDSELEITVSADSEVKKYQARPDINAYLFDEVDGELTDSDAYLIGQYITGDVQTINHIVNNTKKIEMSDAKLNQLVSRLVKSYDLDNSHNKEISVALMSLQILKAQYTLSLKTLHWSVFLTVAFESRCL